ncbi:Reversal of tor2 lethality [Aspergillus nanangensis]|uniref:Protein ROT1 n=1 Tax=Aspergillus nanangensis TaxID=2582783 RepID=A0AAD4D0G4_ASPNN|nr:Reversal of tor2 lethality [Aspergillus nanangensis]
MIAGYFALGLIATVVRATSSVTDLVGTWSTKSRNVITGPGFYDPINDKFLEPNLTGISYSFTSTGHYEEAYFRALSNREHMFPGDGSLHLTPIEVDGRQLLSDPCSSEEGIYTRYNQTEEFNSFKVSVDPYHNIQRLDLQKFDDSFMHPMYLIYQPPQMLPVNTLNPVSHKKRHLARETNGRKQLVTRDDIINPSRWLWLGLFMTVVGGFTFVYS